MKISILPFQKIWYLWSSTPLLMIGGETWVEFFYMRRNQCGSREPEAGTNFLRIQIRTTLKYRCLRKEYQLICHSIADVIIMYTCCGIVFFQTKILFSNFLAHKTLRLLAFYQPNGTTNSFKFIFLKLELILFIPRQSCF